MTLVALRILQAAINNPAIQPETAIQIDDLVSRYHLELHPLETGSPEPLEALIDSLPLALPVESEHEVSAVNTLPKFKQALVEPLTEREQEVLHHIAAGLSNREIAKTLVVSLSTVKSHINNLYGKLGTLTRDEAIARAQELNLL